MIIIVLKVYRNMERVWIGVGSNLLNPKKQVDSAMLALSKLPKTKFMFHSSYYCSAPVGMPGQPFFLNAVAVLDTNLEPEELLIFMQHIEKRQGRIRKIFNHWISRTLDLDILLFGKFIICTNRLIIPHYAMLSRGFVMYPLFELDNNLVFPNQEQIRKLIKHIPKKGLDFWKN